MKKLLDIVIRAYAALAAYLVALVILISVILFAAGALTRERVKAAVTVLRTPAPREPEPGPDLSEEERRQRAAEQRARELDLARLEKELQRLDDQAKVQLGRLANERDKLERDLARLVQDQAALRKDQEAWTAAKTDAEVAANLPILSKMDGPGIVSLMKGWDDARIVRYLRAMKPAKAAEVLETIRTDPQLEQEFRQVSPDEPKGTKTRAERLMEELKEIRR